jgi:hypothetical protein
MDGGTATARAPAARPASTTRSAPPKRLTDTQITQVMGVLADLDSVELKLTVPANARQAVINGLPIDPVEAEPRQVFFFDTPKLALNEAGIVVRARRIRGGAADTVVKLRPVVPSQLPESLRRSGACKVELDVIPGGYVCSASLKGGATGEEVKAAVEGKFALSKLFSKEQRAFYKEHAPRGLTMDKLVVLGPTYLLRSRFYMKQLDRKVTAEYWLYPDGSRLLELSTKAVPREGFQVAVEFRAFLADRGIDMSGEQQTKTASALKFFKAQLSAAKNGKR